MAFHTYKCGGRCKYCFENSKYVASHDEGSRLKFDLLASVVQEFQPSIISHYGGEPMYNEVVIRRCIETFPRIQQQVATAGKGLTMDFIEWLVDKPHARIHLSIDGSYIIHNVKRPIDQGDYNMLMEFIKYGSSLLGPRMKISMTIDDHNYLIMEDCLRYFIDRCPDLTSMEVGHVLEGQDFETRGLQESTWKYLQLSLEHGIDTEWTNWADGRTCGGLAGQSMALDPTGKTSMCDSGICSDNDWPVEAGSMRDYECRLAKEGVCDVKHCNLCVVDNLTHRGDPEIPSSRCKTVYECLQTMREVIMFTNRYADFMRLGKADTAPLSIRKVKQHIISTSFDDYYSPKLDPERACVRPIGPEHFQLIERAYRRSLKRLTEDTAPALDRMREAYSRGDLRSSFVLVYRGVVIGGMIANIYNKIDGTADLFIWSEEGLGKHDIIAFHICSVIGALKLHLEHDIWTMWSEVLDVNTESQRYTNGNWGFVKLGTVPRMCSKDGDRHNVIISYGTIVTTMKVARRLASKHNNTELEYLMKRADSFMEDNEIDPDGDS